MGPYEDYCERRYFYVYKFSRMSESWPFHMDLCSHFGIVASIGHSKSYFHCVHNLRGYMINAKICTAQTYLCSQYT